MSGKQQTSTVEQARQQLEAARMAEAGRVQAELDRRRLARLDFARERMGGYDQGELQQEVSEAWSRFRAAVEQTPMMVALADALAAEHRRIRAGHAHAADMNTIAEAEGHRPAYTFDAPAPTALTPDLPLRVVADLARHIVERDQQAEVEAEAAATTVDLTPEQVQQADEQAELVRRRAEVVQHSVSVEGMTEAERARLLLPPGTTYGESGGSRRVVGS